MSIEYKLILELLHVLRKKIYTRGHFLYKIDDTFAYGNAVYIIV